MVDTNPSIEPGADPGTRLMGGALERGAQARHDLPRAIAYSPISAADTMATSLSSLLTGFQYNPESYLAPILPQSYSDTRYQSDAIGSTASLLLGGGALMKIGRVGGVLDRAASATRADAVGAAAFRALGRDAPSRAAIFSNMARVEEVDRIASAARLKQSTVLGGLLGVNMPRVPLGAEAGAALRTAARAPAGSTTGDILRLNRNDRIVQAFKDTVYAEAAIFALYNNSDFLFPKDMGLSDYALTAALGVGVGVGLEAAYGRAVMKRAMADASIGGAEARAAADQAAGGRLREGAGMFGVIGEQWINGSTAIYTKKRVQDMESQVHAIVRESNGLLSEDQVYSALREVQASAQSQHRNAVGSLARERLAVDTLRGRGSTNMQGASKAANVNLKAEVNEVVRRTEENDKAMIGLAELTDTQAPGRHRSMQRALEDRNIDEATAIAREADPVRRAALEKKNERTRAEMAELENWRVGTMERSGAVNYDPGRRAPHWEMHRGAEFSNDRGAVRLKAGGPDAQSIRLLNDGTLRKQRGKATASDQLEAVNVRDLNFDEITALQTMVGKLAASQQKRWMEDFWNGLAREPDAKLEDLPFPILDAIQAGLMRPPEGHALSQQIESAVAVGHVQSMALGQKLDWARKNVRAVDEQGFHPELSLFDIEKAVNVRLTDDIGQPNGMGHAFRAFMDQDSVSGAALMHAPRPNEGFDRLWNLGLGWSRAATQVEADVLEDSFFSSLRGLNQLEELDRTGGIGAIYHRLQEPTDGEMALAKLAAMNKAARMQMLQDTDHELLRAVWDAANLDPNQAALSREVSSIFMDHTVKNNVITQTTFAHRFQRTLQAAHHAGQEMQRAADALKVKHITPIADRIKEISRAGNGLVVQAEVSNSARILERGVGLKSDTWVAGRNDLDMTRPGAQKLIDDFFGDLQGAPARPEDWQLFDVNIARREGRYVPVELSDDAAGLLNQISQFNYYQLDALNELRRFAGRFPINKLNGHVQTADFSRYEVRYVKDASDRVVGYIKARTPQEADRLVAETVKLHNAKHGALADRIDIARTSEIADYHDALDQPFTSRLKDWSGFGQTGQTRGRAMDTRLDISGDFLEEMLVGMRNSVDDIKNRMVGSMYADAVEEGVQIKSRMGYAQGALENKTFYDPADQWQRLLQAKANRPQDSATGRAHNWIESIVNGAVGKAREFLPGRTELIDAMLNRPSSPMVKNASREDREAAEAVLNGYTPWSSLANKADLTDALKINPEADPFKAARALQQMNRLTGATFLKFANVAHPILNMTGVVATMPSVVQRVNMREGETLDAWKRRVGPISDYFDPEKGAATVSPAKLMSEGMHLVFNDKAAYDLAFKRGYLTSNLLEELNKSMKVNPSRFEEAVERFAEQADILNRGMNWAQRRTTGQDPSAFTISERSETFTRAWAHMTGVALGRRSGLSEEQAHTLGYWFSNQNIADFAPNIRGEAFQGLAGIPFGLFQSYGVNILQRLFTYVENKDARSSLYAAFMQTAMFGSQSLPGWPQLNEYFFNGKDVAADERGATSLNERIYAAHGKDVGDFLMTGMPSSFFQVFGESGINLYTSGDINPRLPLEPPAFSLIKQVAQGGALFGKAVMEETPKLFKEGVDADWSRGPEVLANYVPARGVRSMLDLGLTEKVDRNGNLVNDNTWETTSLIARMLGTRTTNEMQMSGALWQNGQAQAQRISDMGQVRDEILGHLRSRDLTDEENKYYLAKYILQGGREDQWARWLAFSVDKARNTRDERALQKLIQQTGEILPHNFAGVQRIEMAGGDVARAIARRTGVDGE